MKPATPLPWKSRKSLIETRADNRAPLAVTGTSADNHRDAAYIVHAANAYQPLVEALGGLVRTMTDRKAAGTNVDGRWMGVPDWEDVDKCVALLDKLGEGGGRG